MGKNCKNKNFNNRGNNRFNKTSSFNKKHMNHTKKLSDNDKKSREFVPRNSLQENQVGITEYVTPSEGFTGVLKSRFSDFHVNEIDLDGNVVRLTDFTIPKPEEDTLQATEFEKIKKEFESVLTEEHWKSIEKLISTKHEDVPQPIDIDVTELDKDKRTQIHKLVKQQFETKIVSSTVSEGDKKLIRITKSKGRSDGHRSRWTWDGEYVHFVVHKENVDTVQAACDLATALRMKPSQVNYAGTKDKRGVTTQVFCIKKREPSQIVRELRRLPYMKIGNFQFKDKVIKLGDLKGNRFHIALRHVNGDEEKITPLLEAIKTNGFINYYGLQRFGNCASVPTYEVGIALLKSDFKTACELILKPREEDPVFLKNIRETWWKYRNSAQAASMFRNDKHIEKKLLDGLAGCETDYATALRRLPRNMLLLYTHAYQSLIWNRVASRRINEFGMQPIVGDLVYREGEEVQEVETVVEAEDVPEAEDEDATEVEAEPETEPESVFKQKVRPLTEEDIASGKYTIFDIVLPQPGHDITYPANETAKWYEEILAESDLSSEKLKHNVKTYSLAGAYRKLVVKPENMEYSFKLYDSAVSTLIASDYDILKEKKADESVPNGSLKALLLNFSLPSSCYATMFLREILKSDTSSSNQAKIGQEEMEKHSDKVEEVVKTATKRSNEDGEEVEGDSEAKKVKVDEE